MNIDTTTPALLADAEALPSATPFDFQTAVLTWKKCCALLSALCADATRLDDALGSHFDDMVDDARFDATNAADAILTTPAADLRDVQGKLLVWHDLVGDAECIFEKHVQFFSILRDDVARLTPAVPT